MGNSIQRISAIIIECRDHQALAEFYRQAFDFGTAYESGDDHTGFPLGNIYIGFERVADEQRGVARTSAWFHVEDVPAAYRRLIELGATGRVEPHVIDNGEPLASVIDPEGNVIGLLGTASEEAR